MTGGALRGMLHAVDSPRGLATVYHPRSFPVAVLLLALLGGCAALRDALDPRPPTATVTGARLAALNFEYADLVLDVRIDNPNALAIELAGFDYRLRAAGRTVLEGERTRQLELPADRSTAIEVPLRIRFGDIAGIIGTLSGRDAIAYDARLGLQVELPVIGQRRVAVEKKGTVPVPHRPRLTLEGLGLERLDLQGATLRASVEVFNPNGFALTLDQLDYRFNVDGATWARGGSTAPLRVPANGRGELILSLDIDFAGVSGAGYDLFISGEPIDYRLLAVVRASASDDRLGQFKQPWRHSGRIELR